MKNIWKEEQMDDKLFSNPTGAKTIRRLIWAIVAILIFTILTCWLFYAEPYRFFQMTISDLGTFFTVTEGNPNSVSQWVFTHGFLVIAGLLGVIILLYIKESGYYAKKAKIIILGIFLLGAIGTASPYDSNIRFLGIGGEILHVMHYFGAAFFVIGFATYNFISQLLRYIRKKKAGKYPKKNLDFWVDLLFVYIVFIAVVWYLLSGLLGLLDISKVGFWSIFPTALSQKILLFVSSIAAFLLDENDI